MKIIYLLLILAIIPIVSASYCFQETANVSTVCGGLATGSYANPGLWMDGNYNSYTTLTNAGVYVNYTIPATNIDTIWQYTCEIDGSSHPKTNLTVDSSCLINNKLQLHISKGTDGSFNTLNLQCLNASGWVTLLNSYSCDYSGKFYEEGVYWNQYSSDTEICYQNNVTKATCRQSSPGELIDDIVGNNKTLAYDGDFNTYANITGLSTLDMHYKVPDGFNPSNGDQMIIQYRTNSTDLNNVTVDSRCITRSYESGYVYLYWSMRIVTTDKYFLDCSIINPSANIDLVYVDSPQHRFYDMAAYWNYTKPKINITSPANNSWSENSNAAATVTYYDNDALNSIYYSLNGGGNVQLFSPENISCYQESFNVSNQTGIDGNCNLAYTGALKKSLTWNNFNNSIDGDFTTAGYLGGSTQNDTVYINYTMPRDIINNVYWKVNKSCQGNFYGNLTIPSDCYSGQSVLQLMFNVTSVSGGLKTNDNLCYNYTSSSWIVLNRLNTTFPYSMWIADEGIYWNVTTMPKYSYTFNPSWVENGNSLIVYGVDNYGESFSSSINYNLDTSAPVITSSGSTFSDSTIFFSSIFINLTFSDSNLASYNITIDNVSYDSWTGSATEKNGILNWISANSLSPGWHTFAGYATDILGHRTDFNLSDINPVIIDNKFRSVKSSISSIPTDLSTGQYFTFTAYANITGTGLQTTDFWKGTGGYFPAIIPDMASFTITGDENNIYWTGVQKAPSVTTQTNGTYYILVGMNKEDTHDYDGNILLTNQTIYPINLSTNCTSGLQFSAKNEEYATATEPITFDMNIDLTVYPDVYGANDSQNFHYTLSGKDNYTICINPYFNGVQIDAVIEYSAVNFSDRKYFLLNTTLNNQNNSIVLYLLPEVDSTDVVYQTIEDKTANIVPQAYVKIFRYYPGENLYRLVEVEKTDANGMTVGKVQLADVWYKYVVESPAGTVRLATSIEKVTSATRTLVLSSTTPSLSDIDEKLGIIYDVSCTKSTQTCRFTWDNPTNNLVTGKLTVWSWNGWVRTEIYESQATLAAGTIVYTIPGDPSGMTYIAQGAIVQ